MCCDSKEGGTLRLCTVARWWLRLRREGAHLRLRMVARIVVAATLKEGASYGYIGHAEVARLRCAATPRKGAPYGYTC